MKGIRIYFLIIVLIACAAMEQANARSLRLSDGDKTKVYYFHNTRRCPTCEAIEKVTKSVLNESYKKQMEEGTIEYASFNAEEKKNKELCKKLNVTGSALIVLKGEQINDLTSKGFMYALNQPEKLKDALVKALQGE